MMSKILPAQSTGWMPSTQVFTVSMICQCGNGLGAVGDHPLVREIPIFAAAEVAPSGVRSYSEIPPVGSTLCLGRITENAYIPTHLPKYVTYPS